MNSHNEWIICPKSSQAEISKSRMIWNSTEFADHAGQPKPNICGIFPTQMLQSLQHLIQYEVGHFDARPWISWRVDGRGITKRSTPRAQTDCPLGGWGAPLVGGEPISPESQPQNPARGRLVSKPPPQPTKCKF